MNVHRYVQSDASQATFFSKGAERTQSEPHFCYQHYPSNGIGLHDWLHAKKLLGGGTKCFHVVLVYSEHPT